MKIEEKLSFVFNNFQMIKIFKLCTNVEKTEKLRNSIISRILKGDKIKAIVDQFFDQLVNEHITVEYNECIKLVDIMSRIYSEDKNGKCILFTKIHNSVTK